ncbi:beta-galactosidase [Kineococcus sp. SYSU DK005]|uniref:beta-galactosidase n=1 Tax=Kineococcus sp. SYSU DK005 TaxID=3383126 RepID=UPI003D7CD21D
MNDEVQQIGAVATDRRLRVLPPPAERRGHLPLGEPEGSADRIEVTSRWIERAGRPWFPITGEVHYSRLPRERWKEVLGHARAGGLNSVATYVFWSAHEPEPGHFRWEGNCDLRAFIELAADFELDVVVRMGPWGHGEARYGAFPDWLVERDLPTRTNDPEYLALARAFYAQTIAQLRGLSHGEGGPVIAAQMDNELYDQPQHLATLREMAEDLGLRVPLWTATGWGGAQLPPNLLPLYSAYSDGFWEDSRVEWPAFAPFHFRYSHVRDDLSVGADLRQALDGIVLDTGAAPATAAEAEDFPFATCELGGGMHVAYHRRPLVAPEDVAALSLAKIGSGSIWQGYYMYAGGTQRVGAHGTEQESHATGYPNDIPTRTYDFHAPIGEHGQIRPHHHYLRRQHLWLAAEGHRLAPMGVSIGGGSDDPDELRWAVRSDGRSGYLFLTTYQPAKRALAAQKDVQVSIDFPDTTLTVPTRPVDIPAGRSLVWPLRYALTERTTLRSATAQIITRLTHEGSDLLVLSASPGVPVQLLIEGEAVAGGAGTASAVGEHTLVELTQAPGKDCVVELADARILVLDEATADQLYRLKVAGEDRLVLADAPVHAEHGDLVITLESGAAQVSVLPAPVDWTSSGATLGAPVRQGLWTSWNVQSPQAGSHRLLKHFRPESVQQPPARTGGPLHRLSAPTDYSTAARLTVRVPSDRLQGADRALLRVRWSGDTGRAVLQGEVISDHFWHGRDWDIDISQHRQAAAQDGVLFELLPWRSSTGVWVDPAVRDVREGVHVESVELITAITARLQPATTTA